MKKLLTAALAVVAFAGGALTFSSRAAHAQMTLVDSTFKTETRPSVRVNPCLDDRGAARVTSTACGQWTWVSVKIYLLELKSPTSCAYPPCRSPYSITFNRPKCANGTYSCLVVASVAPMSAWSTVTAPTAIKKATCQAHSTRVDYVNIKTGATYADVRNGLILNSAGC